MKHRKYRVWFDGKDKLEFINIYAGNIDAAQILAQARRINNGQDYTIRKIEEVDE